MIQLPKLNLPAPLLEHTPISPDKYSYTDLRLAQVWKRIVYIALRVSDRTLAVMYCESMEPSRALYNSKSYPWEADTTRPGWAAHWMLPLIEVASLGP